MAEPGAAGSGLATAAGLDSEAPFEPGSFITSNRRSRLLGGSSAAAVSSASTLVVVGGLLAAFVLAPGAAPIRSAFFNVQDMKVALLGDPSKGIFSVGSAFVLNIEMFLSAEALVLVLALVVAVVRQSRSPVMFPLRLLATIYTDLFRGVPLLLVVYAIGFGVPSLYLRGLSDQPSYVYGVAALVLSYSAYVAEVYRAGINSVPSSQLAAARSLGLTQAKSLRFVVLPQAVRTVIPPLLNDFVSLQKDTALVAVLGAVEAARAAEIYSSSEFNYSGYTVAAVLFLVVTIPLARLTDRLIARDRTRRLATGAA